MIKIKDVVRNMYTSSYGTFGARLLLVYEGVDFIYLDDDGETQTLHLIVKYTPWNYGVITFTDGLAKQLNGVTHQKYFDNGYFDEVENHISKLFEILAGLAYFEYESLKSLKKTIMLYNKKVFKD